MDYCVITTTKGAICVICPLI
jgi:hypothetical protein